MTTATESKGPDAQEQRAPFVPGAILRALGALVDADALHEACRVVHLAPCDEISTVTGESTRMTRAEAVHGRVYVRVAHESGETIDLGVLVDARTAARFSGDEFVEIDGCRVVRPFELDLEADDGSGDAEEYPSLDELAPQSDQRLLAVAAAKDMKKALSVLVACGCDQVEILAPRHKGGSLGLRGVMLGLRVEASLLSEAPFEEPSARERDVAGQRTIEFTVAEQKPRGRRRKEVV